MKVVVEVATEAREELVHLLEDIAPTPVDALITAVIYADDITRTLEQHAGPPPDAIVRHYANRQERWWLYADGVWVAYTLATRLTWLRRQTERTIRVVAVASQPGVL